MTEPHRELSPDARAALQALKAEHALEPNHHRAMLRRIEQSIAAGDAAAGGRVDALMDEPDRRASIPAWTWALAAAAAVAIAIWGIGRVTSSTAEHDPRDNPGVAPYQADEQRTGGEAEAVEPRPVQRSPSVPAPVPESVPVPAPVPVPEREAAPSESRVHRPTPKAEPRPKSTGLSDEMALMRRARAALDTGDPAGALEALRSHAQRHDRGQLVEDRLALQIIALCELGKLEQARNQAVAFGRRFPSSHYQPRIASCLERNSKAGDGSQ